MADVTSTVQNAASGVVGVIKALIVLFVFVNIIYSTGFDPIGGIVDLVNTFLDGGSFPYGLKEPPIGLTSKNIRDFLSMDLHIHIGSHDVKVTSSLNQSDGAMRQGPNRFKRAINFYQSVSKMTEQNNLNFNWSYKEIRGVDHSNRKMAPSAAAVLID